MTQKVPKTAKPYNQYSKAKGKNSKLAKIAKEWREEIDPYPLISLLLCPTCNIPESVTRAKVTRHGSQNKPELEFVVDQAMLKKYAKKFDKFYDLKEAEKLLPKSVCNAEGGNCQRNAKIGRLCEVHYNAKLGKRSMWLGFLWVVFAMLPNAHDALFFRRRMAPVQLQEQEPRSLRRTEAKMVKFPNTMRLCNAPMAKERFNWYKIKWVQLMRNWHKIIA